MLKYACVFVVMFCSTWLRGPSVAQVGTKRPRRQYINDKAHVEQCIAHGERVVLFMVKIYGKDKTDDCLDRFTAPGSQPRPANGSQLRPLHYDSVAQGSRIPDGFLQRFMTEDMRMQYTRRKQMQLRRALVYYVGCKNAGASTMPAMRGMHAPQSCRSNGGALNGMKANGLGFALS